MNLTVLLIGAVLWAASIGGSFWYGTGVGEDHVKASDAKVAQAIQDTRTAAAQGAAEAISKLEIKNVTVNRTLEREVRTNTVFADCHSGDSSVRIFNSGIPGYTEPAGDGKLPAANTPAR